MVDYIKIHPDDNVIVALSDMPKGYKIERLNVIVSDDILAGHKLAIADITCGNDVLKYAHPIGKATQDIARGEHVHTHNLRTNLSSNLNYTYQQQCAPISFIDEEVSFKGYLRKGGDVGIRNELWIVPTVGCVNGQAKLIAEQLKAEVDTSHLDDVLVLSHQYGCSQLGDDHANTQKALAAAIQHPNAGAVLVLGLGCENNQVEQLKQVLGKYDEERVRFLVCQDVEDELEEGVKIAKELVYITKTDTRTYAPLSKLKVGLKCGGSDGFSGLSANPLLGQFSDWLVAQGGSTVLTEVPEMFGAETILMNRAKNKAVFDQIVELINGFKAYFRLNNEEIYENPSPGNKQGGISTLEEKSLGCTQKGGMAPVNAVLNYGDRISTSGLNLLWSPGNDLVASSALAMSGCQMVLFTTGRGTPFGSFVPTMKIASNSTLFKRKNNWMDFNAGPLVEGQAIHTVHNAFKQFVLAVANGKKLKHEEANFKEIAIFKSGVTL